MALYLVLAGPAMSLPPDPERPMNATTCAEAQARLHEAELGSPLVPAERNEELLAQAREIVARLCPGQETKDYDN